MKRKWSSALRGCLCGLAAGFLNGLLGAGGGMAVVPMLEKSGLEPRRAHATSIAVIVPVCVVSACFYGSAHSFRLTDILPILPAGLLGSFLGAKALPHIPANLLRRIFGAFMLYAAFRLLHG